MKHEIELKFRIGNPREVREKLRALGAVFEGRVFERNVTFDDPERGFGKVKLLRVRDAGKVSITFKGEPESGRFKKRKEIEIVSDDFGRSAALLKELGFEEAWRYEKERETWKLGNVEVVIDRLPFLGWWVEIEGSRETDVESAAGKLGFDISEGTGETYKRLFMDFCREKGIAAEHMLFSEEKEFREKGFIKR